MDSNFNLIVSCTHCIVQNFGGVKLWQIIFRISVKKMLANSQYCMERNFGGGKRWRICMNSPTLSHPNFLQLKKVSRNKIFYLHYYLKYAITVHLMNPLSWWVWSKSTIFIAEHDHKRVAHGLSPCSPPQPVDCRDFLLLICKSALLHWPG